MVQQIKSCILAFVTALFVVVHVPSLSFAKEACEQDESIPHPGWNLALKASRGNKKSVYDLWTSTLYTRNPTPLEKELNSICACHFKSKFVERWESLSIKKVLVAFYENDDLAAKQEMVFDGTQTNKMNWFSKSRLLSSTWTDLTSESTTNYFNIEGDFRKSAQVPTLVRRFIVNKSYGGCLNDNGWCLINDAEPKPCPWEAKATYWPSFLYSKKRTSVLYGQETDSVGYADVFAIFIYV